MGNRVWRWRNAQREDKPTVLYGGSERHSGFFWCDQRAIDGARSGRPPEKGGLRLFLAKAFAHPILNRKPRSNYPASWRIWNRSWHVCLLRDLQMGWGRWLRSF